MYVFVIGCSSTFRTKQLLKEKEKKREYGAFPSSYCLADVSVFELESSALSVEGAAVLVVASTVVFRMEASSAEVVVAVEVVEVVLLLEADTFGA